MISAIIVSYKREQNIPKIIEALQHPAVTEIIVFNNNPDSTAHFDKCVYIKSNKNYKCWVKYTMGAILTNPYVLSIDDDLMPSDKTIDLLLSYKHLVTAYSSIGMFGLELGEGNSYSKGKKYKSSEVSEPKPVDILLGRCILATPAGLAQSVLVRNSIPSYQSKPYIANESEDIILSLALRDNYVVPANKDQMVKELPEHGVSLHKRKEHRDNRDKAVLEVLKFLEG